MATKLKELMETPTASINITPSSSTQTIDVVEKAIANVSAMPRGATGTVSATKSISGNTATITPSISAGTAGYNEHAAKTGTAVTVQANELVSGSTTITTNTTTDVTNYASVVTNISQAVPIEISTEAAMNAVLISANVGKAYIFIGATTSTYTQGDIYIVREN